jgi:hypothetical protein
MSERKSLLRSLVPALYFLPFLVFAVSCSSLPLPPDRSPSLSGPSSYCELLHVPLPSKMPALPKPYLGIYLSSKKLDLSVPDCKESLFIVAEGIVSGGPADEAGIEEGDIIFSLNKVPTCRYHGSITASFKKRVEELEIGSTAEIEIIRKNQRMSLTAKLKARPLHHQEEAVHHEIGGCKTTSLLERALLAQSGTGLFDNIREGLFLRSNTVHNPGWSYEKESNKFQSNEVTFMMRHPVESGIAAKELTGELVKPLHNKSRRLDDLVRRAAGLINIDLASSDSHEDITFPRLLQIMEDAKKRVEAEFAQLTPDERRLIEEKTLNPWDDESWNTVLDISIKLDRRELINAFIPLLSFLSGDNLSLLKKDLIKRFGHNEGPVLFETKTPIGKVIVGGRGPNVYTEDAALILDLGGDDLYMNNAGGTRPGMPVALVIDWDGNDRYMTKENFSQGAGVLGGGFLIDLSGNDTFVSLDGSQGTGLFGMGLLYHGDGSSVYEARSFSQGVGQMGVGLLLNGRGNDTYLCSLEGQGLGLFGGAGILIDEGGDDYYKLGGLEPDFRDPSKSTVSMGQGFGKGVRPQKKILGVPGGTGVLIDEKGDDVYVADYFAQGSSYYFGLGILNDMAGNDRYISGRYAQGAGIHSSVGVFLDDGGNDSYFASFGVAQGMGHDYGVGFFEDAEGDDDYWGGSLVQGAATRGGMGIFVDGEGGNRYLYKTDGQGFAEEADGMGIMIATWPMEPKTAGKGRVLVRLGIKSSEK